MTYKRIKKQGKNFYLVEYESYWDPKLERSRQRLLRYLGRCNKNGNILHAPSHRVDAVHSAFPCGSLAIFHAASIQLKLRERIKVILDVKQETADALMCLVLNQITARVPISRLGNWVCASPLPKWECFKPDSLQSRQFEDALAALCHLTPEKTWENKGFLLQLELTKAWRGSSREPAAAYYDITKQQYYGSQCPYGQLGHDERGTATVIGFGMVVSKEHHHPILCQALPGGQSDHLSVAPTLEMLRGQGLKGLRLVMDRGMTTKKNVYAAVDADYDVLGCVRGWNDETRAYASNWQGDDLENKENIVGTSHNGAVYSKAFTAPLMDLPKMKIALVENMSRKAEDRQARDLLLQELEGPLSTDRLKEIRYELGDVILPSKGRRGFKVDLEAVEMQRALDGRFLLFSTDLSLDGKEMYRAYFAKDAIEKVFRTSKGELSLGPVRYRRKDRVDAYATVLYMAYLLWSWAERRLQAKYPEMRLSEAIRIVEGISWVKFGSGKFTREWCTKLTKEQKEILSAVGDTCCLS